MKPTYSLSILAEMENVVYLVAPRGLGYETNV